QTQKELDIYNGPITKFVHFKRRDHKKDILFIVIHHISVDGISWRILFEDISKCLYNPQVELPLKTTSFKEWSLKLNEYTKTSQQLLKELPFWKTMINETRISIKSHDSMEVSTIMKDVNVHLDT